MSRTDGRICYYYDQSVGNYHYGSHHPMKPHRLALTHALVDAYGLLDSMTVITPQPATEEELLAFHTPEYLASLRQVARPHTTRFGDCPLFRSVYDYCRRYAGGSVQGARRLCQGQNDVVINWAGGLHHARKAESSGFCYVNDIVLAILELLRTFPRVLYVDIDIHHGDAVQDAFYHTDRVMTLSFHKYAPGFFPGTGGLAEHGHGAGKYFAVNVPLRDGMDDTGYLEIFRPVVDDAVRLYRPSAVVLQCGADSLRGDRIGNFNLSLHGHASCVQHVARLGLPLLVVGGGGYTIRNVARCWAYETATILGREIGPDIPDNDYIAYFWPTFQLFDLDGAGVGENLNSKPYVESVLAAVRKNLQVVGHAPSVQLDAIPPEIVGTPPSRAQRGG